MKANQSDRRREPRRTAQGPVMLLVEGPVPVEVSGRLVDVSLSGFRAAHRYFGFSVGERIRFEHAERSGEARVAWNRITGGSAETGFVTVEG